ncbi:hypothetical protein BM221_003681 [Beauveria bassiana]|uniref:Uncharacterized protein n=1 Tax=Beauveria bassiana TaxID=176275 RepID=A0A2N6NVB4_BEABA|nr:hypothetical protein BM221_003681 [Beauveria bassiana]
MDQSLAVRVLESGGMLQSLEMSRRPTHGALGHSEMPRDRRGSDLRHVPFGLSGGARIRLRARARAYDNEDHTSSYSEAEEEE